MGRVYRNYTKVVIDVSYRSDRAISFLKDGWPVNCTLMLFSNVRCSEHLVLNAAAHSAYAYELRFSLEWFCFSWTENTKLFIHKWRLFTNIMREGKCMFCWPSGCVLLTFFPLTVKCCLCVAGGTSSVGHSRSGRLWPLTTTVLPWHRRHSHVLLHRQPWQLGEHPREVDTRGEALLPQCPHHLGGQQERSA